MKLLEDLIVYMRYRSDVWMPSMEEAARYCQEKL